MSDIALAIARNLNSIYRDLHQAKLIAVTKYSTVDEVVMAYEAGHRDFGENKVQDLRLKALEFEKRGLRDVRWHFIGHLQSNKVKDLFKIPNLKAVHSVDSVKLIEEFLKRRLELDHPLDIFFQVNTSDEDEKSGFEEIDSILQGLELLKLEKNFRFLGLMTIGKMRTDDLKRDARICFEKLILIKSEVEKRSDFKNLVLSMGMSQDYEIAIEMGSNYIRVGSKIFNHSF